MSEERTSLIRLQEHAFTLQPDAVRVLIFSVYDFSECHIFGALRADSLAPGARRSSQNAYSDNPATQGLPEHAD